MKRQSLYFVQPYEVAVQAEEIAKPGPDQVLVQTLLSAISPGTELLIYRGQVPESMPLDDTLADLGGNFTFPFKYGYATVGRIIEGGANVDTTWLDQLVFAFHPHESHFVASPDQLLPLPDNLSPSDAIFLPSMETALNLVMDGEPLIGEGVVVFGQGIVGLLTTALLAQFPLAQLITVDPIAYRREASLALGASQSLAPANLSEQDRQLLFDQFYERADLLFELSGNPAALDQALTVAGFASRIVVGSWYGSKLVSLDLGSRFHRQRIRLISSQVSTISPELSGRWTKARRLALAWQKLREIKPASFITQQFPLAQAPQAYALLDQTPEQTIQVVLTY